MKIHLPWIVPDAQANVRRFSVCEPPTRKIPQLISKRFFYETNPFPVRRGARATAMRHFTPCLVGIVLQDATKITKRTHSRGQARESSYMEQWKLRNEPILATGQKLRNEPICPPASRSQPPVRLSRNSHAVRPLTPSGARTAGCPAPSWPPPPVGPTSRSWANVA